MGIRVSSLIIVIGRGGETTQAEANYISNPQQWIEFGQNTDNLHVDPSWWWKGYPNFAVNGESENCGSDDKKGAKAEAPGDSSRMSRTVAGSGGSTWYAPAAAKAYAGAASSTAYI